VVAADGGPLPRSFWMVLAIWVVFSLGNSSDVFLLLRAKELGLGTTLVVLSYAGYNVVYSGLSWPLGAFSDRHPREIVLGGGLLVFGLVYLGFAVAPGSWAVWPLFAVYGAYIAATDGVARAWVADQVPGRAIGTAYGIFSAATGGALLLASIAAGLLWSHVSPKAPFVLGAVAAGVALALLLVSSARPGPGASSRGAPPPA
jgi:MFS family permease